MKKQQYGLGRRSQTHDFSDFKSSGGLTAILKKRSYQKFPYTLSFSPFDECRQVLKFSKDQQEAD